MAIKKKKVLFIHPDLRGGGAEKVLVNLLNTLSRIKYDISLLTIFNDGVNKDILKNDIKHITVLGKVFRGWSVIQKIFPQTYLFKRCVKDDYDIIISYLEGVPTRILGGCSNPKTKLVAWVHVDLSDFDISHVFRSKNEMELTYLKMDAVIGVSNKALDSIRNIVPITESQSKVIHNVLDTDLIINQGKKQVDDIFLSKEVINLCSVGRLTAQKGYERLIESIAVLIDKNIQVHLYLLGEGELRNRINNRVQELNLSKHVTLLGFKTNPHKYVEKCDLFVCSSYQEGFSTAVTEAVVLGVPVLTTDCAGMDEILEDGRIGMIVKNDGDSLTNGLIHLLTNNELLSTYKNKTQAKSIELQKRNNTLDVESLIDDLLNNHNKC